MGSPCILESPYIWGEPYIMPLTVSFSKCRAAEIVKCKGHKSSQRDARLMIMLHVFVGSSALLSHSLQRVTTRIRAAHATAISPMRFCTHLFVLIDIFRGFSHTCHILLYSIVRPRPRTSTANIGTKWNSQKKAMNQIYF